MIGFDIVVSMVEGQSMRGLSIRWLIQILCVFTFFLGLRNAVSPDLHPIDIFFGWAIVVLTIFICAEDAKKRGSVLLHSYRWLMFFTWPVSIWIYFIVCRRIKGLAIVFLGSIVLVFLYLAGGLTGCLIVEG